MPDPSAPPINLLLDGTLKLPPATVLEFARYTYEPQSLRDARDTFTVPMSDVTADWLANTISNLGAQQELAFHSRVRLPDGEQRHLPMIDFAEGVASTDAAVVCEFLREFFTSALYLFSSGRSVHAYGDTTIPHAEWIRFMGTLLLLNPPSGAPVIDHRWVGHRLRAGYSALRWSFNTQNYLDVPRFTGKACL